MPTADMTAKGVLRLPPMRMHKRRTGVASPAYPALLRLVRRHASAMTASNATAPRALSAHVNPPDAADDRADGAAETLVGQPAAGSVQCACSRVPTRSCGPGAATGRRTAGLCGGRPFATATAIGLVAPARADA